MENNTPKNNINKDNNKSSLEFSPRILLLLVAVVVLLSVASIYNDFYSSKGMSAEDFIKLTYIDKDVSYILSENYLLVEQPVTPNYSNIDIYCLESEGKYTKVPNIMNDKIITIYNGSKNKEYEVYLYRNNDDYIFYMKDTYNDISISDASGIWDKIKIYSSRFSRKSPSNSLVSSTWFHAYPSNTEDFTLYFRFAGMVVKEIPKSVVDGNQ